MIYPVVGSEMGLHGDKSTTWYHYHFSCSYLASSSIFFNLSWVVFPHSPKPFLSLTLSPFLLSLFLLLPVTLSWPIYRLTAPIPLHQCLALIWPVASLSWIHCLIAAILLDCCYRATGSSLPPSPFVDPLLLYFSSFHSSSPIIFLFSSLLSLFLFGWRWSVLLVYGVPCVDMLLCTRPISVQPGIEVLNLDFVIILAMGWYMNLYAMWGTQYGPFICSHRSTNLSWVYDNKASHLMFYAINKYAFC